LSSGGTFERAVTDRLSDCIGAMMVTPPDSQKTESEGASAAVRALADELVPIFYQELRTIARRTKRKVGIGATLQTTALVNEAYLKLRATHGWNDDSHFLCAAALAMRHVLVNHANSRVAAKRGAGADVLPLTAADHVAIENDEMLINLNEALARLAVEAPRLAQVVECRYFGGYDEMATARALKLSDRTVRRDWTLARAWLHRELEAPPHAKLTPD
jgi:RNA polymerase sigma factor (TIGR02999 family)